MEYFYELYEKDGLHCGKVYHYEGDREVVDFSTKNDTAVDAEVATMDYIDEHDIDARHAYSRAPLPHRRPRIRDRGIEERNTMKTEIFKNYSEFLNRADKSVNGVTAEFLAAKLRLLRLLRFEKFEAIKRDDGDSGDRKHPSIGVRISIDERKPRHGFVA